MAADLSKLSVHDCQLLCGAKGIKKGGKKGELVSRLEQYLKDPSSVKKVPGKGQKRKSPAENGKFVMTMEEVDSALERLGVEDTSEVSSCVKAGIMRGHVRLKQKGLKATIGKVWCDNCDVGWTATLEDVLYQGDYGDDYEDGSDNATATCPEGCKWYITRICKGKPEADIGKGHNHCRSCPNFGICIGDYREAHCNTCGDHYWHGLCGDGKCDNCTKPSDAKKRKYLEETFGSKVDSTPTTPKELKKEAIFKQFGESYTKLHEQWLLDCIQHVPSSGSDEDGAGW
eukprot:TRINITY_DN67664_c11_g6_i1.p2 TRINITY_DN67664_c11_g6~~TRINITY_DN67664_c11_g6_i1.p2  ORF type:complete len:286 (+),score=41.00 TRINITY_DN67664_c11_g6_i1:22-879(+)